ncbi:unnamed protein product [Polarella glacialis]|uniref:Uncharacterized protein n=1 Tax=Polarella glacialis TaxID=89957 RepID=A0A813KDF2_POLGL|nr:unnamed protein product [Polarella glacialis]
MVSAFGPRLLALGPRRVSSRQTNLRGIAADLRIAANRAVVPELAKSPGYCKLANSSRFARLFPSWREHAGVAMFAVGIVNSLFLVSGLAINWLSVLKRHELDCRAQRLHSELERTERQLAQVFGPLTAITHATQVGFKSFVAEHEECRHVLRTLRLQRLQGDQSLEKEAPWISNCKALEAHIALRPRSREGRRYRGLVLCTLQPLNRQAMDIALNHTHLIDGDFPECLYSLYAHVIEMDSLLERWRQRDFSALFARTPYPMEVNKWASNEFQRLRQKQTELILELEGRGSLDPTGGGLGLTSLLLKCF